METESEQREGPERSAAPLAESLSVSQALLNLATAQSAAHSVHSAAHASISAAHASMSAAWESLHNAVKNDESGYIGIALAANALPSMPLPPVMPSHAPTAHTHASAASTIAHTTEGAIVTMKTPFCLDAQIRRRDQLKNLADELSNAAAEPAQSSYWVYMSIPEGLTVARDEQLNVHARTPKLYGK